jgi:hypothetical protein
MSYGLDAGSLGENADAVFDRQLHPHHIKLAVSLSEVLDCGALPVIVGDHGKV